MNKAIIINYLGAGAAISIIMATFYVLVQQMYRDNANDPQIELACELKQRLEHGKSVEHLLPGDTIELGNSLRSFITFYNDEAIPLRSTALLNNKMPALPRGVYDFTKQNGEDWITWQPQTGIRIATIVVAVNHPFIKFIAVSRSLYEIEKRETNLSRTVFLSWFICISTIVICAIFNFPTEKNKQHEENK